jgi:hypothetical protein
MVSSGRAPLRAARPTRPQHQSCPSLRTAQPPRGPRDICATLRSPAMGRGDEHFAGRSVLAAELADEALAPAPRLVFDRVCAGEVLRHDDVHDARRKALDASRSRPARASHPAQVIEPSWCSAHVPPSPAASSVTPRPKRPLTGPRAQRSAAVAELAELVASPTAHRAAATKRARVGAAHHELLRVAHAPNRRWDLSRVPIAVADLPVVVLSPAAHGARSRARAGEIPSSRAPRRRRAAPARRSARCVRRACLRRADRRSSTPSNARCCREGPRTSASGPR